MWKFTFTNSHGLPVGTLELPAEDDFHAFDLGHEHLGLGTFPGAVDFSVEDLEPISPNIDDNRETPVTKSSP